tara:strand:- start:487 stop:1533 length:1047 start_codon:yes stop_codon:yes gene_type:complete
MIKNLFSINSSGYLSESFDKTFNIIFGSLINKDNDKIGFLISLLFHSSIIFVAIGIPSCFQPNSINMPNIIPVEILNIDEITRIPDDTKSEEKITKLEKQNKKEERFSKSEKTEIIKFEKTEEKIIKEETKVEDLKETIEDDKQVVQPVLEKKPIIENEYESLPTKDIKPKIKPKPKPKPKPKKQEIIKSDLVVKIKPKPKIDFNIASVLKDLRKEKVEVNKQDEDDKKSVESEKSEITENQTSFSISEIDLLKQQLYGCWTVPAGAKGAKDMKVRVRVWVNPNKTVSNARILDTNRMQSDPYFRTVAESTLRAVLNPVCSPLKLPDDKYDIWKKFVFVFELGWMLGN